MYFYLVTKTPYVPAGSTPVTIDIARDGTVSVVDRAEELEYDMALQAFGGDSGPLSLLLREIEEELVEFFLHRDLVNGEVMSAMRRRAIGRLLDHLEEFDPEIAGLYRTHPPMHTSELAIGATDRAIEIFRKRPDLTMNQYGRYVRAMEEIINKLQDIFGYGMLTGHLTVSFALNMCGRAAYHINTIRTIMHPGSAHPDGAAAIRAEYLLQLGDFIDAVEAERDMEG